MVVEIRPENGFDVGPRKSQRHQARRPPCLSIFGPWFKPPTSPSIDLLTRDTGIRQQHRHLKEEEPIEQSADLHQITRHHSRLGSSKEHAETDGIESNAFLDQLIEVDERRKCIGLRREVLAERLPELDHHSPPTPPLSNQHGQGTLKRNHLLAIEMACCIRVDA